MVRPFIPFKVEDHVYHNEAFAELCKDAVRAFNGTPVCELPPPRFAGSGVYAIYCTAKTGLYERYGNKVNRMGYNVPIYVGKAVPQGWRQSRTAQPLWNKIFGGCKTTRSVTARWARLHFVRFRSKADKTFQDEVRKLIEVA